MSLRLFSFIGVLFLFNHSVYTQELYTPRTIQNAYKNQTRSEDGKPGKKYWQNHAKYDIKLTVNPPERTVYGSEEIIYTNESPDTLYRLNFKLIINSHKPGSPRGRQVPEDYLTTGIHIDAYKENGKEQEWDDSNDATNKFIKLSQPLAPGANITLNIDWHYSVSKRSGREGAIKENTFFLAYFFPRIAVYDDYYGWDRTPHILSQEFYNDFNDYTFEVTVPKNYIVWATGILQNPKEVLSPHYYNLFQEAKTSDSVIHIATQEDLNTNKITQQNETNTWKWKAENVTDIAVSVSNEYKWDAGSVIVDEKTGRRASVHAAYDSVSTDFESMVEFTKHALKWFSNNWPGIPYPYPSMSVVRGEADMEYPMMANDSSNPDSPFFTRFVVEHEIAHTYFPFYMGTNETRFGFMDEGWATTFEYLIGTEDLGEELADQFYQDFRVKYWSNDPTILSDIPIIVPSNLLSGRAMGNNEYGKPSLGYLALKDMLGDDLFKKVLHGYIDRWNGKHPMPWDFFNSFNDLSGKDLNWFWNAWFFSPNYIDFGIKNVKTKGGKAEIRLENIGGMPAPISLIVELGDGVTKIFHQTSEIWKDNLKCTTVHLKKVENIKKISIDGGIWMDADMSDNIWER